MRPQAAGIGTSALLHGVVGLILYFLAIQGQKVAPPVVIDLSILAGSVSPAVLPRKPDPVTVAAAAPAKSEASRAEPEVVRPPRPEPRVVKKTVAPLPKAVQLSESTAVAAEPAPTTGISESPLPDPANDTAAGEEVATTASGPAPEETTVAAPGAPGSQSSPVAAAEVSGPPMTAEERWRREHFNFVTEAIRKNMTYPLLARKNGWQGRVRVSFVIRLDGQVENVRIEESSGFALLDKNAVTIIKQIAPFPNPPVQATLIVPIDFTLG